MTQGKMVPQPKPKVKITAEMLSFLGRIGNAKTAAEKKRITNQMMKKFPELR